MEVNQYIKDLLFTHDCVTIPGLGAFMTDYQSAKIDPENNTLAPPTKGISFNNGLKEDDGILKNHIAAQENIDIDASKAKIEDFVAFTMSKLVKGEKIQFDELGELYFDEQQKLIFTQNLSGNFLMDSFGLPSVNLPTGSQKQPIKTEKVKPKVEKILKARPEKIRSVPPKTRQESTPGSSKKRSYKSVFFIAIPLILIGAVVFWQFDWIKNKYSTYTKNEVVTPAKDTLATEKKDTLQTSTIVKKDTVKIVSKETVNKSESRVNEDLEKLRAKIKVVEASMKNDKAISKYYLIAGSFKNKENAEKLQEKIHNYGFNCEIILSTDNLYRVTLGGLNSVNDVLKTKEKFYATAKGIDLWVLKNL